MNNISTNENTGSEDYETLQTKLGSIVADSPMTRIQIMVIAVCFILNMIDGMDVLVVSFTSSMIETEWGLSKGEVGYIYSMGLLGMTIGCLFIAPQADKIGRKNMLFISTTLITIGMLSSAVVTSYHQLLALRLITGLGIGGILPTMAAMASEFSNEKSRNFNVGIVQAGWPIGAIITGFFVAWSVPEYGWRFAYATAGVISLIMLPLIYFSMPESLEFLGRRQPSNALYRINQLLAKMKQANIDYLPARPADTKDRSPVKKLFTKELKPSTLLLWMGIFFSFMTLYTLISWIPNIAKDSGMPFEMATYAGTLLNVGAFIGTVVLGWLSHSLGLKRLILSFMLLAFVLMYVYGNVSMPYGLMFTVIFLIGVTVQGGFNGFYPMATRIYPINLRATGIGWAVGAGRTGAIVGPLIFGVLLDQGVSISILFILFSVPLVIAGICAFLVPSKEVN